MPELVKNDEDRAPRSRQEVLYWLEGGRIGGQSAVRYLQQLTPASKPSPTVGEVVRSEVDDGALQELDALVGLVQVKAMVREIQAFVQIQNLRQAAGLKSEAQMMHMVFKGPPGTGKTTVARILGKVFRTSEVLSKGHLVEVERADLVGEYIGHTAQKTREAIRRALGGILFVDEAYSLARGGAKDFGKEAIDTLVKAMEDQKGQFILILAGYPREMNAFIDVNPGLRSRFSTILDFPDYSPGELVAIVRYQLRERQYHLARDVETELERYFEKLEGTQHPHAGNARMVRNLIEHAMRRQALRLTRLPKTSQPPSREALMELRGSDFQLSSW